MTEGLKSEALSFWNLFFEKIPPACLNEAHLPLQGRLFSAKRWTKSSSLSKQIHIYKKKKHKGKILVLFLAQKERLDGFSTRRVRFANSLFYVPFCSAKRWTKSSSLLPFLHYTEKRYRGKSRYLSWRRRRDSNSRAGYPTYALSRGASSPTWVLLHW